MANIGVPQRIHEVEPAKKPWESEPETDPSKEWEPLELPQEEEVPSRG